MQVLEEKQRIARNERDKHLLDVMNKIKKAKRDNDLVVEEVKCNKEKLEEIAFHHFEVKYKVKTLFESLKQKQSDVENHYKSVQTEVLSMKADILRQESPQRPKKEKSTEVPP